jgi:NAD(P)-dependent dehydrogenase (short-subunit alcohol dehydrogenase family)
MEFNYKSLFQLDAKTAIVTGGTGMLGKAFCRGLAEFGANIAVVDLNEEKAAEFANIISGEYSVQATGIGCDVSDPHSVKNMVFRVVEQHGRIDILHNNAASKSEDIDAFFAPFEDYSLSEWRKIMSVNIDGMFLVAQAVGDQMIKQGHGGSIVQTGSIYGIMASDKRIYEGSFYLGRQINNPAVYSASKAAVVGLSKYLAAYWADKNIRVNTLVPGGVESGQNQQFKDQYSARVPMNRMANPYEMVGALLFLVSEASSYITGQTLVVDGGLSCW